MYFFKNCKQVYLIYFRFFINAIEIVAPQNKKFYSNYFSFYILFLGV